MTLLDVMRLAADRDGIAREYATTSRSRSRPACRRSTRRARDGLTWDDAVVETFLTLLAAQPGHARRPPRRGGAAAESRGAPRSASLRAASGSTAGGARSRRWTSRCASRATPGNPGTTADLTAAAIFVVLLGGGWSDGWRMTMQPR